MRARLRDVPDAMRDDRGSMLPLAAAVVAIALAVIAVVVDSSAVYLQRRALAGMVDAAALAGARAIDLEAFYAGEWEGEVPLDRGRVRDEVVDALVAAGARQQFADFRIVEVSTDGAVVTVTLSASVVPPLRGLVGLAPAEVTAQSAATTPLG